MLVTWATLKITELNRTVVGVSDEGGSVCGKSGAVFLALRRSSDILCSLLLEDHLGTKTQRPGRSYDQGPWKRAECRRTVNLCYHCGCCCSWNKQSFKASQQFAEERHQDDDSRHFLLHRLLAAPAVHDGRSDVRPAGVRLFHAQLLFGGDRFCQPLCKPVHLCHRPVPVCESQVHGLTLPNDV